jgi:hypothetical protein
MSAISHRGRSSSGVRCAGWTQAEAVGMASLRNGARQSLGEVQQIEGTANLSQVDAGDLQVAHRGIKRAMPKQELDGARIDARLQEMGREAVATLINTLLIIRR